METSLQIPSETNTKKPLSTRKRRRRDFSGLVCKSSCDAPNDQRNLDQHDSTNMHRNADSLRNNCNVKRTCSGQSKGPFDRLSLIVFVCVLVHIKCIVLTVWIMAIDLLLITVF